jgi:hypothetical protein
VTARTEKLLVRLPIDRASEGAPASASAGGAPAGSDRSTGSVSAP